MKFFFFYFLLFSSSHSFFLSVSVVIFVSPHSVPKWLAICMSVASISVRQVRRCFIFLVFKVKNIICCLTTNLLHPEENLDRHWNRTNTKQSQENAHPNATCQPRYHFTLDLTHTHKCAHKITLHLTGQPMR